MGFELPDYLKRYLNTEWRKPPTAYINTSLYYANLDPYFIEYMRTVIRPCMAYANGVADGNINNNLTMDVGHALKKSAVRLIKGDRIVFNGDDKACEFLSDTWVPRIGFEGFLEQAIDYLVCGGTTLVKLDIDRCGRIRPNCIRVDRAFVQTDNLGDVIEATIIISLLFSQKVNRSVNQYWLVERRYYNENKQPCVKFIVHSKGGTARNEVLPALSDEGLPFESLPPEVQSSLEKQGISLNEEMLLPFRSLGCWQWQLTASNSCVPGLHMGDPLLYGALDLLFSIDTVFCGSMIDVLQGKGKILVPKTYIREVIQDLNTGADNVYIMQDKDGDDDSFVYVKQKYDENFKPESVQFDIRTEKYSGMLETYLRMLATVCGFSPTTVFPFLADQSVKTATEVTSEDNLTRATVQSIHSLLRPCINEMIDEVLRFHEFSGEATIQLSDYIGNILQRDSNLRQNYASGAMPTDTFIQRINGLSTKEAKEWAAQIAKEQKDKQAAQFGGIDYLDVNYQ